jgi:Transposase family tnp2
MLSRCGGIRKVFEKKCEIIVHSSDGEDWKQFDQKYLEFAAEVRNVRLGLSIDGFMSYNSFVAPYSFWPIFVFPHSFPSRDKTSRSGHRHLS